MAFEIITENESLIIIFVYEIIVYILLTTLKNPPIKDDKLLLDKATYPKFTPISVVQF